MTIIASLIAALAVAGVLYMLYRYLRDARRADSATARKPLRFPPIHKLTKLDALAALIITLAYGVTAFAALGDRTAPQTFYRFTDDAPALVIDLGDTCDLSGITYYTGSFHDRSSGDRHIGYYLELSPDGENFTPYGTLTQTHADTFHWMEREFTPADAEEYALDPTARYLRIYAQYFPMELGELFVLDSNGAVIDPANYSLSSDDGATFTPLSAYPAVPGENQLDTPTFDNPALLFDEQPLFAADQTYMNSMYFDEIYHGRTAREFLLEEDVYENTHPPLGKSIISLGITLFGMTPFGWRFMGTLFGVLMVPFAYAFIKNLFGKTWLATCGTLIFAFEFMHFTQTRIATIDTYGLFFTILMYFFMYRFLAAGYDAPARSRLIPLALCGISFGCGIASKWTCFYAAAGLVILYVIGAVTEFNRLRAEDRPDEFLRKFAVIVAVSVLFFVGVAGAIYYLSYLPFAAGNGKELSLATVWQNQTSMFNYHSGLSATHSHQSSWWMWLLDVRPILYVFDSFSNGTVSAFSALNTPIVSWAGLAAVAALAASLYRSADRTTKLTGAAFAAITAAAFAAQIVTYAVTYMVASAQGLDLVEDVAYTHHPFSYVFAVAAVCTVITPFVSGSGIRRFLPAILFTLATAAFFAMRLIGYDPESTSLVSATDTPLHYAITALVCAAIALPFTAKAFRIREPDGHKPHRCPSSASLEPPQAALGSVPAPSSTVSPTAAGAATSETPTSTAVRAAGSARSLFLLIAYLSQLLAWIPVTRNTFAYHYFPSSFFLVLALCSLFDHWSDISAPAKQGKRARRTTNKLLLAWLALPLGERAALLFTAASLALFALFYPYLSGAPIPRDYLFTFLRWLPSWPM